MLNFIHLFESGMDVFLEVAIPLVAVIAETIGLLVIIISLIKSTYHYLRVSLFHDDINFHLEMCAGLATSLEFLLVAEVAKAILLSDLQSVILLAVTFLLRAAMSILLHAEMKTARAEHAEEVHEAELALQKALEKKAKAAQNKKTHAE